MSKQPFVVIGNGGAAAHAVSAMRKNGYAGEIRMVSDYKSPVYNPVLTSYYAAGKISRSDCFIYGNDMSFYEKNKVETFFGEPVLCLDARNRFIKTETMELEYSKCLVASGARPFIPPIQGVDNRMVVPLRTMKDADRLKDLLDGGMVKDVLVTGASMVGFKAVEACLNKGIRATMADICDRILPLSTLDASAAIIEKQLADKGVAFKLGIAVSSIQETGGKLKVSFGSGESAEYDLVIMCVGVVPNIDFIDPKQIEVQKGILVDNRMKTSDENVYAAGDVTAGYNLLNGRNEIIGLWANATYQGRTAGSNMAGKKASFEGSIPQNVIHVEDIYFAGIGYMNEPDSEIYESNIKGTRSWFAFKNGLMIGANILSDVTDAGILRHGILKKMELKKEMSWGSFANFWMNMVLDRYSAAMWEGK